MAGSAIVRRLASEGCEILTADRQTLDLTEQTDTERWLADHRPDAVFVAAGHVGGIYANDTYPADFIVDNLAFDWQAGKRRAARRNAWYAEAADRSLIF
jgi:GDP-L-fucose synthase